MAILLETGITAGIGTGATVLATGQQGLNALSDAINEDLKILEKSLTSLSEVVLQNRRRLNLLFLKDEGVVCCLKEKCYFYADHTRVVRDSLQWQAP